MCVLLVGVGEGTSYIQCDSVGGSSDHYCSSLACVCCQLALEKVVSTMQLVLRRTLDCAQGTGLLLFCLSSELITISNSSTDFTFVLD